MGLNCAMGPTPDPDGTCESCRAIVNNSSLDVVEMDAASNRGIDEIRDLRDRVNLAPVAGRMKVYIIDEVRSEEHTSELQSRQYLVCRLLLEKKNNPTTPSR